jgi:hypothetical protein
MSDYYGNNNKLGMTMTGKKIDTQGNDTVEMKYKKLANSFISSSYRQYFRIESSLNFLHSNF